MLTVSPEAARPAATITRPSPVAPPRAWNRAALIGATVDQVGTEDVFAVDAHGTRRTIVPRVQPIDGGAVLALDVPADLVEGASRAEQEMQKKAKGRTRRILGRETSSVSG